MQVSSSLSPACSWLRTHPALSLSLLFAGLTSACGGSTGGGGQVGIPDQLQSKPDEDGDGQSDGLYFVDINQGGGATRLHIAEILWGRLVDVHDVVETYPGGVRKETVNADPLFSDFVIREGIQTDGTNYTLQRNPITQKIRLVIHDAAGLDQNDPADPLDDETADPFDLLLRTAADGLTEVVAKNDDGSSAPPFTRVPRNACVVVRFDDCLKNDSTAALQLPNTVRAFTGYPPVTPFAARAVFDPNHGAVVGGRFRSTRVLVDMTVSELEASQLPVPQPVNGLGLPSSLTTTDSANVSLRFPTQIDLGSGQFAILTNLAGVGLTFSENSPVDLSSPTADVVRAVRSGNANDLNNGFLLDGDRPQVVGTWSLTVDEARDDDALGADPGLDFLLKVTFPTVCQSAAEPGDVITVGAAFLEVTAVGDLIGGQIQDLAVRSSEMVNDPDSLVGTALFLSTLDPALVVPNACWLRFTPPPSSFPSGGVSTSAQIFARFSEPMDPASLSPFESFVIVKGVATPGTSTATALNLVVGQVLASNDLATFGFLPLLPFPHTEGLADPLHLELFGPTDLAGNPLGNELPFVDFTLDPLDPTAGNAAVVLRFDSVDELAPSNKPDLRGQFFNDFDRGVILPRPVAVSGWPADRTIPVPQLMTPVATGVFTPLTPLGARLQTVWRYCDVGWDVLDETKYNVDVIGLDWAPIGGQIVADFYESFEMRVGHSRFQPDEAINTMTFLPLYPNSGLQGSPNFFEDNYLNDPLGTPRVVHNRALGYTISRANLFLSSTQTQMMPYPLNRGSGLDTTYTWRDTAVLAKGAPNAVGIPLEIETVAGVTLLPKGSVAGAGNVPSFGLPLLVEVKCFPSDTGIGLNLFDVSIANAFSPTPNFRAFSSGGVNTAGQQVSKNPDLELIPSGGFNPASIPPGQKTRFDADNVFYLGQLDIVVRVSRVHSIWLDSGAGAPSYMDPVLEPGANQQPDGVAIVLDYRGATNFSNDTSGSQFDASRINAYGELTQGSVTFLNGISTWKSDIRDMNGARYVQLRLSFVNNIQTGLSAELSALAIPYLTN